MNINSYHIIFLGDIGVGKTSIATQFIFNRFGGEYEPTIEDIYRTQIKVDGLQCFIEIPILGDIGSQEFTAVHTEALRKADGFAIVYSITSLSSFEMIGHYLHQLSRIRLLEMNRAVIVIGNKIDLESNRQVSPEKGRQLATNHGYCFIESSAKLPKNIPEIFDALIRQIHNIQKLSSPPKKSGKCYLQ